VKDLKFQSGKTETRVVVVVYCIIQIMLTFHVSLTWNTQVESMWFELKTKLSPILININYRSERESHINYWQLFESMIVKALDENSQIICLGDLNKNCMGHLRRRSFFS
jgi:hypothetical protein